MADPRNTRLAGGQPRNAYDQDGSAYLGTELDAGLRYRLLLHGAQLTVGVEGGVRIPGGAYAGPEGEDLGNVFGGRAMLHARL